MLFSLPLINSEDKVAFNKSRKILGLSISLEAWIRKQERKIRNCDGKARHRDIKRSF
jgi:hypothetical protein